MGSPLRCLQFAIVAAVIAIALSEEVYSDKYDNINVDVILRTPRLRKQYENCYMNTGSCTADAKFLKDTFPEALVTKCKKCTEKQKQHFEAITVWYTENDPETWNKILQNSIQRFNNNPR